MKERERLTAGGWRSWEWRACEFRSPSHGCRDCGGRQARVQHRRLWVLSLPLLLSVEKIASKKRNHLDWNISVITITIINRCLISIKYIRCYKTGQLKISFCFFSFFTIKRDPHSDLTWIKTVINGKFVDITKNWKLINIKRN